MNDVAAEAGWQPDLHSYEFESAPIATLNRLRAEDPVHWSRHGYWFLTRHADVMAVLSCASWACDSPASICSSTSSTSFETRHVTRR